MLQIYNEKIEDLFVESSKRPKEGLKIRESRITIGHYDAASLARGFLCQGVDDITQASKTFIYSTTFLEIDSCSASLA